MKNLNVVVLFLLAVICVYFGYKNLKSMGNVANAANDSSWQSTWVPIMDSDYGVYYVNNYNDGRIFRQRCGGGGVYVCQSELVGKNANDYISSAPPTVIGWNVGGNITGAGYSEEWMAGDGLKNDVDFYFQETAEAGPTRDRDSVLTFFTGRAKIIKDQYGFSLLYKWHILGDDQPNGCGENADIDPNTCSYELRWGEQPNTSLGNDADIYLDQVRRIEPGQPTKWTVTGRLL
jgi:hypothetical protein